MAVAATSERLLARTVCVCASSAAGWSAGGRSISETEPWWWCELCWLSRASEPTPFVLATNSRPPSALSASAPGYQPVGSQPRTVPDASCRRITATALSAPQAAYSVPPSGLRVSALTPEPNSWSAPVRTVISPMTASRAVSITLTTSLLAQATYTRAPSALAARPQGSRPTGIAAVWVKVVRSITLTEPSEPIVRSSTCTGVPELDAVRSPSTGRRPPQLLTYSRSPSRSRS